MILKKLRPIVYFLSLFFFLILHSCEKKTLNNSIKKHNTAEIDRLVDLGDKYFEESEYDSSYYYFNKAKLACDEKKDVPKIIYSISNLATIQQNQGDYSGSETTAMEAIPFLEKTTNPQYKWNIYTVIGINYLYAYDYENALYYYYKALNLKTDELRKSSIKNNIALTYMEMGNYKRAIQILYQLTFKKEVLNDTESFSRIVDNLGYSYFKVGNSKALNYLNQSLKIKKQKKDDWGLISSYYHLSEFYKKSNVNLGNNYARLAYEKATKLNSVDSRLECLKLLIQNSSANKSKEYSLKYLHINDSITKVRQKAKNQFAKIKYDSKKEKDENLKLKAQKTLQLEHQKKRNLVLYTVVGIITLISIFITNLLLARNKREKIKASYTTEIRIAKKLHDELANDVYHTMAFAETQDLSTTHNKEILISNLDTIYSRTRNISRENNAMETGPLFISDLKEMMSGFNTQEVNVITNGMDSINWMAIDSNKKIIIYRVIQELLVNMKKHSQCSLVVLTFKKIGDKLQIDYTDNGVGATIEQLNSKNGLQNVENRIQAIKGLINFDTKSNKGFKVQFIIPI
ncbi:tetratricopeptide repeat-containing sensor histidine kinase [Flavobacterium yafengii]|uniref:tetratricopeptide repeat-containing sensor histidine kinase n=1 Tax=Flavobacterium yafengii TaxID=3041253 RepID=UPI0024A7EE24|nr:ATP-binding protein [Flavobacterium yafengii]MDI5887112.1 ATP-binding protein [Flavobacterium yafengii]